MRRLAVQGIVSLVFLAGCGGSNPTITNPTIATISPTSAAAGGAGFTLTVSGTNFVAASLVNFGGTTPATTVVSSTQLTAAIPAVAIASAGTVPVTVSNPARGGGISNVVNFSVATGNNPVPAITTSSPRSAVPGGPPFTLRVNGTNFVAASVVNFGGTTPATTVLSSTQLTAAIPAAAIASAGTVLVTVTNPPPGGGTSHAVNFTVSVQGQGVSFEPAVNYSAGNSPASVAVGDFNRDDAPDLAVANGGAGTVSVLLNNRDGTFLPASDFAVVGADHVTSVAVADFSHFGTFDLAVTGYGFGNGGGGTGSWVLHGNGDGTFRWNCFVTNGCCGIPVSQAVGEFNHDSWPDVVTANHDHLAVMMGAPGCFVAQIPPQYHAGSDSRAVAVGDFNGDGIQDLAVANGGSNNASVLLGNADGTFSAAMYFDAGVAPSSVVVGDFNDDLIQDLAVANAGSNNVSVLLGNGDGTFQPAVNFDVGDGPSSVVVEDFNRDGRLDLAVANAGSNNVSVLLGNGDGTFQPAVNFDVGDVPMSVALGDFNLDGLPDLVVAISGSNGVSVLINNTLP